jgi:hypothetical protein
MFSEQLSCALQRMHAVSYIRNLLASLEMKCVLPASQCQLLTMRRLIMATHLENFPDVGSNNTNVAYSVDLSVTSVNLSY